MRIGIDIMGGDFAPGSPIKGSLLAREHSAGLDIIFVGDKNLIRKYAADNGLDISSFEIVHTEDMVQMGDHPLKSFAKNPNASIFLGQKLLREGKIDGFCSSGNTGAMLVGAMQIITPIPGVTRPAIAGTFPNDEGNFVILDVGLNPDARPDVLFQYGKLGSLYAQFIFSIENPRVGLLNIGAEEDKGNLVIKSTFQLMKETEEYNFIGNVEANSLFVDSVADVLVCDGFVGNIVLKEVEAFYKLILSRKIGNGFFEMFNFENFGGTPILGVQAPLVIGHGISNELAIKNMILQTSKVVESGLVERIRDSFRH